MDLMVVTKGEKNDSCIVYNGREGRSGKRPLATPTECINKDG